jgi:hypothetical protein
MSKAHLTTLAAMALKLAPLGRLEFLQNSFKRQMSKAHLTTLAAVALKLAPFGQIRVFAVFQELYLKIKSIYYNDGRFKKFL